jgi:HEAT repeat protein
VPSGEAPHPDVLRAAFQEAVGTKSPLGDLPALRDALARCLTDQDADTRAHAAQVLERLEEDALPIVPNLVTALGDSDPFVRWSAARALGAIEAGRVRAKLPAVKGAEATMGGLIALIYSKDARTRDNLDLDAQIAAINALRPFGEKAARAVDALGEVVASGDFSARLAALQTLSSLHAQGVQKTPRLASITQALVDRYTDIPDPLVQLAAAKLLGEYGPAAAEAIPALHGALRDPHKDVRRAASDALMQITR